MQRVLRFHAIQHHVCRSHAVCIIANVMNMVYAATTVVYQSHMQGLAHSKVSEKAASGLTEYSQKAAPAQKASKSVHDSMMMLPAQNV